MTVEEEAEKYAKECFPNDEFKQAMVEDGCLKFYEQGQKDYQLGLTIPSPKTSLELNKRIQTLEAEVEYLKDYLKGNIIHNTENFLKTIE